MSTFVQLVNKVLVRVNEVPMDIAGDGFDTARGPQALAKDAVNSSLRELYQVAQEWPFLKTTQTQVLIPGTREYDYPSDWSSSNTEAFYLKYSPSLHNEARVLKPLTYEDYLHQYRVLDDSGKEGSPEFIYQTLGSKFGVSPTPDQAYEVEYIYWSFPEDLIIYDDPCVVPSRFDHVVVDGAMMYMMHFRSNEQSANMHQAKFEDGIKAMRRVVFDDPHTLRSTVIAGRS